jgi:endonuclease YncB( thermonuclease family)
MLLAIGHHRRGLPVLAALCFSAGILAGALIVPAGSGATVPPPAAPRSGHPAEVLRVIDGDTFEARVAIWPGMQVTTRVRLRGIDAPEMRGNCPGELAKAHAAREALAQLLKQGAVGIANIGQDKYGGRVDADVSTARTADVAAALLARGVVRRYASGRREGWCG